VVRIACARATEADLDVLTANVDEAEWLIKAKRFEEKIDVQIEFHNILARCTRNAVMQMLMGATMEVMRDFAHAAGGERNDLTIEARRRLLAALRKRDADAAVAAMTDHLEELRERYRDRARPRK
jgi:GntR family transcriptional regulator, transcriptional repressor for pyruvate dehydrogenase complex